MGGWWVGGVVGGIVGGVVGGIVGGGVEEVRWRGGGLYKWC